MREKELDRQDLVDNSIFELINSLNIRENEEIPWDIEVISKIREIIQNFICKNEEEEIMFYPYIEEDIYEN